MDPDYTPPTPLDLLKERRAYLAGDVSWGYGVPTRADVVRKYQAYILAQRELNEYEAHTRVELAKVDRAIAILEMFG